MKAREYYIRNKKTLFRRCRFEFAGAYKLVYSKLSWKTGIHKGKAVKGVKYRTYFLMDTSRVETLAIVRVDGDPKLKKNEIIKMIKDEYKRKQK